MLAVHIEAGEIHTREVPVPSVPDDFALLKLRLAGICNTDLELQQGYYGFTGIPGHEFVADVVEADDSSWVGKRVVGEINLSCGRCTWCDRGLGRHCPSRKVLGIVKHPGAFSEYFTLPIRNLHQLPRNITDEVAVFTEPVAAGCAVLEQVAIPRGTRVAVLGDGKLGLLTAMVLSLHGAQVVLLGRHPEKMAIARELSVTPRLASDAGGEQFPVVVEATGSPEGLEQAIRITEPRGKVVMKSTVHQPVSIDMANVIVPEISLVGSRCGRFTDALPLLAQKSLPVERMIHAEYSLADAAEAFAHAGRKGTLKVLLRP